MKSPKLAIVGGESLLGRELRDVLADRMRSIPVTMIGADEESAGKITAVGDEAVVITPLDQDNLSYAAAVFLMGSPASAQKAVKLVVGLPQKPLLIDGTGTLEDLPTARLRAPFVEPDEVAASTEAIQVVAHPAAIALAQFFARLTAKHAVRQSIVHVFEPASQSGRRAVDELHQQTVGLLSFKKIPKDLFDAQLSFNMLAAYGDDSSLKLDHKELTVERHLATLLAMQNGVPMPSLRVIQAPVFHGYSFSVWVEFESNPGATVLAESLATAQIDVRGAGEEPPNNVGLAGQGGIAVGAIAPDRNHPRAAWFWIAADNLRLTAENAARIAEQALVKDAL